MINTIGIIGGGFVGHATARAFMEFAEVRIYDLLPEKSNSCRAAALACDGVFVCLPTPMLPDGQCDLAYVETFFAEQADSGTVFVIKSTVPVGTTDRLAEQYRLPGLVFSPEFLTARCSVADAMTPSRSIVGFTRFGPMAPVHAVADMLEQRFRQTPAIMPARDAELVKYGCNSFFAVKVAFFNELKEIAQNTNCDYEEVLFGMLADGRIANSHCNVPGPDGKKGFGGTCLPKDIQALAWTARESGAVHNVIEAAWHTNLELRPTILDELGVLTCP